MATRKAAKAKKILGEDTPEEPKAQKTAETTAKKGKKGKPSAIKAPIVKGKAKAAAAKGKPNGEAKAGLAKAALAKGNAKGKGKAARVVDDLEDVRIIISLDLHLGSG